MTLPDIQTIESELGVRLPDEYRTIMTSDRAQLEGDFWYAGLFNDPRKIVEDTRWLRDLTASYGTPCPDGWIVVSEVNGGDLVILDTTEPAPGLRYWDHETQQLGAEKDSITRFVESTLEAMRKPQ